VDSLETLLAELVSTDDARAARALSQLPQHGELALDYLLELLDSAQTDHRWWAAAALAGIDQPRSRHGLIKALQDSDSGVRQCAAAGLRRLPAPEAIPALIEALGAADRLYARLASGALAVLGAGAVEALTLAMRSEDPRTRIEAARALGEAGDGSAIPALFAALSDPSAVVVHLAEIGLERLGVGMVFFEP
jgi:HEAT repeat protein